MRRWLTRLVAKSRRARRPPSSIPPQACLSVEALEVREMYSASPQPPMTPSPASPPVLSAPKSRPLTAPRGRASGSDAAPDGAGEPGAPAAVAAPPSSESDPDAAATGVSPGVPWAALCEAANDTELDSPRCPTENAAACRDLDDCRPAPFSGDLGLSLTAGPAVIPLSLAGTGAGRPSPADATSDSPGLREDQAHESPSSDADSDDGGLDPAGDAAPLLADPDDSPGPDGSSGADTSAEVGSRLQISVFDVIDDDSDMDTVEEVADMFAEMAESDGSSEAIPPGNVAGAAASVMSW
jgi:hypothetical protein